MLEQLINLDHKVFFAINNGLSCGFLDFIAPILRNKYTWIPLYLFIIGFSWYKFKVKGIYLVLFLAAAVGTADFGSAKILKPTFERDRPCRNEEIKENVNILVRCGSGKSFPSTHATDHFAIAVFLITVLRKKWKAITAIGIIWAAAISFSQVYVGVHFPIDITIGALLGSLIGFTFAKLFQKYIALPKENF